MSAFTRRLLYLGLAIVLLLAIGTAGFTLIEGWPLFDSFYMTITTIATVGYREVHDLSRAGRIFNTAVIVFGVTTLFFAIGVMTQSAIELELGEVFGKRRTKRMIDKLEKHYIVCGYGRVGRSAADELSRAGAALVVVDRSPERVEQAARAGLLAMAGDATRDETLADLGVARASGLVAALATDADNLFLILSARSLNPNLKVSARVSEESAEQKLRRAGADTVYAPYRQAGQQLAAALVRPHVVQFLDVATQGVGPGIELEQVRVAPDCELAGKSLRQVQLRSELGVIVLAIRKAKGEMMFNPPADAALDPGDFLVVMGEHGNLHKLEALLEGANV
jgi:voltage-gated potassium channel